MSHVESLPAEWVARIFAKLSIRYGRAFMARWEGIDEQLVRDDWAEQLASFRRNPDCIAYALANLPADKAPSVGEFRALCNAAPEPEVAVLPAPKTDPARLAEVLGNLKAPTTQGEYAGPKGWAYRLRDREAAGDKLGVVQRRFWREALQAEVARDPAV